MQTKPISKITNEKKDKALLVGILQNTSISVGTPLYSPVISMLPQWEF